MAPIQTKHSRAVRSAKNPRGIYAPPSGTDLAASLESSESGPSAAADDAFAFSEKGGFKVNKKDKRAIRHNTLLAKVKEGGVEKRALKRRRPAKKLKADVRDLADALPDVDDEEGGMDGEDDWEGVSDDEQAGTNMTDVEGMRKAKRRRSGKMVMPSLKHRPGAMKRRRKMEQGEMARFGKSLAQMFGQEQVQVEEGARKESARGGGGQAAAGSLSQAQRWAALRSFIGGTMQKDRAFAAT